jgi:nucleotide-binding universal stress UspA family protein
MSPTFVVGYDGSATAGEALRFARVLAEPLAAEILAAYVYPTPGVMYADPYGGLPPSAISESAELAAGAAEQLVAGAPGASRTVALPGGSVPGELHALAVGEGAALLAVGLTHRGAAARLLPGSIGERLVHGSPCPVAVVPPESGGREIRTVGVAYDGRVEARRALRVAIALAQRFGAALHVMAAIKPGPRDGYMPRDPVALDEALGSPYAHALEDAASRAGAKIEVRPLLLLGPAGPALAGACETGIDLLVVGSRGHAPLHGALLGSTSRHLIDHAPCPLVVVPWSAHTTAVRAFEPADALQAG